MPYPVLNQPSLALGLLKAGLTGAGISAVALYPCLWFAEEIGLDVYAAICESKQEFLLGEWTFAGAAFPDFHPDHEAFLDLVLSASVSRGLLRSSRFAADPRAALWRTREAAEGFVRRAAERILEHRPAIVGCTSTFMQHAASLALLRTVRALDPGVVTVLGGANCEGEMGRAARRCFPWIDFVVSGEADLLFPELCRKILASGRSLPHGELPMGVLGADHPCLASGAEAPRASVLSMDSVPEPDFDDYFAALRESPLEPFIFPALAAETSRGCWWGKKHHCTFCGLNGGNMDFRSKSPDRVVAELAGLSGRYGIHKFNVVDNILDLAYIQSLLPRLPADPSYTLFFETKANLKREQLERIAAAGIRRLQPGIESLHDATLALVEKGTSALQNVQLLKWAREIGVFITWNFLWDIPGEKDEWYGEMADWLPRITHLQPPGVDRIQYHRFSPYHQRPESFGLTLEPYPAYGYVYPVPPGDLAGLAYYFTDPRRKPARTELATRPHLERAMRLVGVWNRLWGQAGFPKPGKLPVLRMSEAPGCLVLEDTRPCAVSPSHVLEGLARDVYRTCAEIQSVPSLLRGLAARNGSEPSPEEVQEILDDLDRRRLLLRLNGKLLALALREVRRIPDTLEEFPAGHLDVLAWRSAQPGVEIPG
jgi:magnesium-protoporphyrin IX monomethyl ester (oxidative) cyclase